MSFNKSYEEFIIESHIFIMDVLNITNVYTYIRSDCQRLEVDMGIQFQSICSILICEMADNHMKFNVMYYHTY